MYKEKATEIVYTYVDAIDETDLHLPEYIVSQEEIGTYSLALIAETLSLAKVCAKIDVKNTIDALERYDDLTEKHLKEEFGVDYFSAELQNMDGDFRFWDGVYNAIDEVV